MRYLRIGLCGLALATIAPVASAQSVRVLIGGPQPYGYSPRRDLRNDYRQLDALERRVQDDEWRLRNDRARRAPGYIIHEDKERLKYDKRALKDLRRDIRRDERGYR